MLHVRIVALGALLFAIAAAACVSGAGRGPSPAAGPASQALATATPFVPPITPERIQYVPTDVSFTALPNARAIWGAYDGGAYRVEVPETWNGAVVYYAHGYRAHSRHLDMGFPSLREHFIDTGFAWAASTYTENGYRPGVGAEDTFSLRDVFVSEVGQPSHSYLFGESMGGHVVTLLLEQHPTAFDGALSSCGVVSGREILDYFASWLALSAAFSGIDAWSFLSDADGFKSVMREKVLPALGPPDALTEEGRAFANVIEHTTGGPRPFLRDGFAQAYAMNTGLILDALAHRGLELLAAQNADVEYPIGPGHGITSGELNAIVPRFSALPATTDALRYPEFAEVTGEIQVPLLTIHTTGDLIVPISLEQSYRRTVEANGNGHLLVQRAIRRAGHCAFTDAELTSAFDDLVLWVESGTRPAGDDLLGDLMNVGVAFTKPLPLDDPGGVTIP